MLGEYAELALAQDMGNVGFPEHKPLSRKRENIFLQHRMSHDKVWKMVDGEVIKMSDMSDKHLEASIAMLIVINQTHTKAYVGLTKELEGRNGTHGL